MINIKDIISDKELFMVKRGTMCATSPQLLEKQSKIKNQIETADLSEKDEVIAKFILDIINEELIYREDGALRVIPFEEAIEYYNTKVEEKAEAKIETKGKEEDEPPFGKDQGDPKMR